MNDECMYIWSKCKHITGNLTVFQAWVLGLWPKFPVLFPIMPFPAPPWTLNKLSSHSMATYHHSLVTLRFYRFITPSLWTKGISSVDKNIGMVLKLKSTWEKNITYCCAPSNSIGAAFSTPSTHYVSGFEILCASFLSSPWNQRRNWHHHCIPHRFSSSSLTMWPISWNRLRP